MLRSRWVKIVAIGLVGILFGAGATGLVLWSRGSPENLLASGEQAYNQGTSALEAKDHATAALRFDEAHLQAAQVLDLVDQELQKPRERTPEEVKQLNDQRGQAFWLAARALRDAAHARAAEDGKPINLTLDSTTGERYRSFLTIPDPGVRKEAIDCLNQAAAKLPDNAVVQNEALRLSVSFDPMPWGAVEQFADRVLKLEPNNPRANYQLATFHFEQPILDGKGRTVGATPVEKRKADRMTKAREHAEKARQVPNAPYWRTIDLEIRISSWFRDEYHRQRKSDKALAEQRRIRQVLLDDKTGVVPTARQDEKLTSLTVYDVRGVLHLHLLALQQVVEDSGRAEASRQTVLQYLDAVLELCQRLEHPRADRLVVQESALSAVRAIQVARPGLQNPAPADLDGRLDKVQALGEAALSRKASDPNLYAQLAILMDMERVIANQQNKKPRAEELDKRAGQWITDGIKMGDEAKLKPDQLAELHALAAQRKTLRGEKPETYEEHLKALRETQSPAGLALAFFLEGVAAERTGRLEKARKLLEKARANAPNDVRINLLLGTVYLSLNSPLKAQQCLHVVAVRHEEIDKLPEQDRNWMAQFMRNREELDYLLLVAHLGAAEAAVADFVRANPGKPVPADRVEEHEREVATLLKRLTPRGPRHMAARHAQVSYLVRTGRKEKALQQLETAQTEHPSSLELLQLELALMDRPPSKPGQPLDPKFLEAADRRIRRFIAETPQETRARLYFAAWMADTGRADKAIEYLENPTNFPTRDEQYQSVLALAQLRKGDRAAGLELLRHLPSSPNVDAALILLAPKPADRKKQLEEALARHEQKGLLYCLEGVLHVSEKEYDKAADSYFRALEFSRVRGTAQVGLQRAILLRAQDDPLEAQKQLQRMLQEAPEQPILYLCYAIVCVHTGEIGNLNDDWKSARNMTTALNMWEKLNLQAGADSITSLLTRAECWILANRYDLAQKEIQTALRSNSKHTGALSLAVSLTLDLRGIDSVAQARMYLDALKKEQPDSTTTTTLEASVLEREGKSREAIAVLEAYLAKNPNATEIHSALHFLLNRLDELDRAAEHAARWRKDQPDSLAAIVAEISILARRKEVDRARELAQQTLDARLKRATEEAAKAKVPEGVTPEDWDKQKKTFLEQIELSLRLEITRAWLRGRANDEAEKWAETVLKQQPDQEAALLLKGDALMGREDWKGAASLYELVLKKHPKNVVAANNLAWILAEKLDDVKRAYEIVEKLRRNPATGQPLGGNRIRPEILDTVGVIYSKLNQPDIYPEMRDLFSAACVRYPGDPRMYLFLGVAQAKLKQADLARENLSRALQLAGPEVTSSLTPAERAKVRQDAQAALKQLN